MTVSSTPLPPPPPPPAPYGPPASGRVVAAPPRPVTRAALWVAFGAALAVPLASTISYLISPYDDRSAFLTLLLVGVILEGVAFLVFFTALVVVALTSPRSPGVRVATILIGLIGAALGVAAAGTGTSDTRATFLVPMLMFLAWALAAGFRGKGYIALLFVFVVIVVEVILGAVLPEGATGAIITGLVVAAATLGIVFAAHAWERQLAREIATSQPAAPSLASAPVDPAVSTNGYAIAALVFGVLGGILAIVFGHVALNQLRRTGGQGRGMAIAGLVLGYFWLAVILTVAVAGVITAVQRAGM
jgi:hypothetical protein